MPNQPKTPLRSIRVEEALWTAALERAHERGETVSEIIRKALTRYVAR